MNPLKIISGICLLMFTSNLLFGQLPARLYEKLKINGPQPVWHETAFHPGLVNGVSDGYNLMYYSYFMRNIIDKEFVYNLLETTKNGQNWGCYIEKRNVNTGKLEWNTKYHETNFNDKDLQYQEVPKRWYIDDNNDLIVLGIRKYGEVDYSPGNSFCVYEDSARVTYRRYDTSNGALKEYYNQPNTDISIANMIASSYITMPYPNIFRTNDSETFRYTELMTLDKNGETLWNQLIRTFKIDKYGHPITKEDTINLGEFQQTHNLWQKNLDTLIYLKQDSSTATHRELVYYDIDLKFCKNLVLEEIPFKTGLTTIHDMKEEYFLLSDYSVSFGPDSIKELISLIAFDYYGKIIDLYQIDIFNDKFNWNAINYLPKYGRFVEGATSKDKSNQYFELIASKKDGTKEILIKIELEDKSRFFQAENILELDGDKILLTLSEGAFLPFNGGLIQYDENARARSIMVFNAADLGLKAVSTNELISYQNFVSIYPNPTSSHINIEIDDPITGRVLITNTIGQSIHNELVTKSRYLNIDLSGFENGIYFIRLTSDDKRIDVTKKVIKI